MKQNQPMKHWTRVPGSAGLYMPAQRPDNSHPDLSVAEQNRIDEIVQRLAAKVSALSSKLTKA